MYREEKIVCKCYRAYKGCRAFNVAEFCVGLKNGGRCYRVFEVLRVCGVFQGVAI